MIKDSIYSTDTTKTKAQTKTTGIKGTGQEQVKSTNAIQKQDNAIIHHSSNQAKIDSIKNAKLKGKN